MRRFNRLLLTVVALALAGCGPAGTPTLDAALAATQTEAAFAATQLHLCCTATPNFTPTATTAAASPTAPPTATPPAASPTPLPPATAAADGPGPRAGADMVFHAGLGMVVMLNGSPSDDRLWGWDGAAWQVLAEGGPAARELGGMAYDTAREVLVVYGGRTNNGTRCLTDTWEWDGAAWTEFDVPGPAVCSHFVMEYAAGQVVVVGGADEALGVHAGMWTWDGAAWTHLDVETPEARFHGMSAYDPAHGRLFWLGGFDINNQMVDELWGWDGAAWERLTLAGPPALSHAKLVFDATRTELLLVGGTTRARTPFDFQPSTWRLTGGAWQVVEGAAGPSPRGAPGAAYDPVRDRVVVYGGFDNANPRLGDTWEWDGAAWLCVAGCE